MATFVYFITTEDNQGRCPAIKIGMTDDVRSRLTQLQTGAYAWLDVAGLVQFGSRSDARAFESECHEMLANNRLAGEWFIYGEASRAVFDLYFSGGARA